MRGNRSWQVVLGAATLISACGPKNALEPAKSAQTVKGMEDAARTKAEGLQLTAQVDAWPGYDEVRSQVTPVRVILENRSGQPVVVKYKNFALKAESGETFAALPPFQIEGEIAVAAGSYGRQAIAPLWSARGYEVAAPYGYVYGASVPVSSAPFVYDYDYYDAYYPTWVELDLPTMDMVARAIPEGTLQPGGTLDGFLYFQRVEAGEAERVQLSARLVRPEDEHVVTTLQVPFRVEED